MTLRFNERAALAAVEEAAEDAMMDVGWRIAESAAGAAPVLTGAGARSIHPEVHREGGETEVRVSWTRDHFYMGFAELGTENQRATPFLRPAAKAFQ